MKVLMFHNQLQIDFCSFDFNNVSIRVYDDNGFQLRYISTVAWEKSTYNSSGLQLSYFDSYGYWFKRIGNEVIYN